MVYVYIAIIMLVVIIRFKKKATKKKVIRDLQRERSQQAAMQKIQKEDTKRHQRSEKAHIDMAEVWAKNPTRKIYADF